MALLQVYVARSCPVCTYSQTLVAEIRECFPDVDVELIDVASVDESDIPELVFATPTWLWDGRTYSLGNPDPVKLWQKLAELSQPPSTITLEARDNGREDATSVDNGVVSGSV